MNIFADQPLAAREYPVKRLLAKYNEFHSLIFCFCNGAIFEYFTKEIFTCHEFLKKMFRLLQNYTIEYLL